jgi:hypothetical protein
MSTVHTTLADPEAQILARVADLTYSRDAVAPYYAACIRQFHEVSFPKVNQAIAERWSKAGLEYVKGEAWKLVMADTMHDPSDDD